MPPELGKKAVFITGASSGIGAATARAFARAGSNLVIGARREEKLQALKTELERVNGIQVLPLGLDVTDNALVEEVVREAIAHFGRIDVLFNNAGIGRLDWLDRMDMADDLERQIDVNLLGVMRVAKAILPHMQARRRGHIINMSSLGGLVGGPTYTAYSASKFGVRGFSEALRREVKSWGIHVSTVVPGAVRTGFAREAVERRKTGITTPAFLALTPESVADRIVRLARRPKRALILPGVLRLVLLLNMLWPGMIDWFVERNFVRKERAAELGEQP
jgi:short-subunit dehydrogenase